ncbi:unnamed protein product [Phyllotreta striolata]|uniref:Uncharacterized protein n=1 Tax=Phyllotreta striolata TaxID=444603 RepID=A0A9N9TW92_PHYSR|nr:unnamed protein product [Phyllotreta striolata]
MRVFLVAILIIALTSVASQEHRLEETKPGICYKIHTPEQTQFYPNPRKKLYSDLHESCTKWIKHERKDCLSLKTQNDEVLILSCIDVRSRKRPGCYKIINRDKREEIVCQKFDKKQGCSVVVTRTNLSIVIGCLPRGYSPSIFDIITRKPPRE